MRYLPVSALEKFPGFGKKNSQTSDLTVTIGNNLAKADAENAFTSGSYRPTTDSQSTNADSFTFKIKSPLAIFWTINCQESISIRSRWLRDMVLTSN